MNDFAKMDVAIELLADQIAKTTKQYDETKNLVFREKVNNLMHQRDMLYNGDINTIESIINKYSNNLTRGV